MKRYLNLHLAQTCANYGIYLTLVNNQYIRVDYDEGTLFYTFTTLPYSPTEAAQTIVLDTQNKDLIARYWHQKTNETLTIIMNEDREIRAVNSLYSDYVVFWIDDKEYIIPKTEFSGEKVKKIIEELDNDSE